MNKQVEAIYTKIDQLLEGEALAHDQQCKFSDGYFTGLSAALNIIDDFLNSLPEEKQEISLERFTEKMDDWKARFARPEVIPVKATMAFTARMFYMYPNVARLWYDSLPKVTQD